MSSQKYLFESRFQSLEDTLEEASINDERIVVMSADISSRIVPRFVVNHPDRYFNFGIAEQNMFDAASGFALEGLIPFAMTLAVFASMRACEQLRTSIAYPNLNVKIIATGGGLSYGTLGSTHMAIEDISLIRAMPNMTVIVPADAVETVSMIKEAVRHNGPIYIRFGRMENPLVHKDGLNEVFKIGKAIKIKSGMDIAIIATGIMVSKGLEASEKLKEYGIEASLYSFHTIKPIDREAIEEASNSKYGIITLEDNNIIGGLGSAVSESLASVKHPCLVQRIGIPDLYPIIGSDRELYEYYGMDTLSIVKAAVNMAK
jgi:transketolase